MQIFSFNYMMFILHFLGGGGQTNEFPNGLNQEPCMEASTGWREHPTWIALDQ